MAEVSKKICLVGSFGVGKTSLIARFVHHTFSEKYLTTLGVKIDTKQVELKTGDVCKLVIWDIAGKEDYSSTDKQYLKGSSGCIYVVDSTRQTTAEVVLNLKKQVDDELGSIPSICAVNKTDLEDEWSLTDEVQIELKEKMNYLFKTSALNGKQVEPAFVKLVELMITHD
jgi:small GTP-binding protein